MPFKSLNGANYYYEESGSGNEIIVFAHGVLWSCRMFDKQVEALKNNYKVIAFDFRGQGKTEVTQDGYDFETLYKDTLELVKSYNQPVYFAGLSMGGMIGMRLAARNPDLVKGLILMETGPTAEVEENIPKYKKLMFVSKYFGFRIVTGPVMKIMFSKSYLTDSTKKEERKYWEKQLQSNDKKGIIRALEGVIQRKDVTDEITKITCPTLIIHGEEDVAINPAIADITHSSIRGSKLVHIPKAGHTSSVENPEPINKEIKEFLSTLN